MANRLSKIFCQRCMAANELGQEHCARCGTRLMLVVEPSASRFEDGDVSGGMEEHILERITLIENNLSRLVDKLGQMADTFLRHTRTAYLDHALLDTLVDVLNEAGVVRRRTVEIAWRERYRRENSGESEQRREEVCEKIVSLYEGDERELFARLVRVGFAALGGGKSAEGFRGLERAAALAPANAPLNTFLGAHYFGKGKTALARDYLSRAFLADPENERVRLLLGLACGDEGEPERARALLSEAVRRGGHSFAAHCALGRIAAAESDWKTALAEFKHALAARPCPEAQYLLGLACYQLGRDRASLHHLRKATESDAGYGAALYLLGIVYERLGERERARKSFEAARAAGAVVRRGAAGRRSQARGAVEPPSLFSAKGRGKRKLVTGGDRRLALALQEDALGSAAPR
ncbi:MAG TPA: tetratricopeptide repeat protein [Pyrinomonadaceae bacterium]|jgi:tetratricopeptide (TPR) repeat protein|nr:tetratricopeptide repeat protein [Pyrinomonadaceae bacterium]